MEVPGWFSVLRPGGTLDLRLAYLELVAHSREGGTTASLVQLVPSGASTDDCPCLTILVSIRFPPPSSHPFVITLLSYLPFHYLQPPINPPPTTTNSPPPPPPRLLLSSPLYPEPYATLPRPTFHLLSRLDLDLDLPS